VTKKKHDEAYWLKWVGGVTAALAAVGSVIAAATGMFSYFSPKEKASQQQTLDRGASGANVGTVNNSNVDIKVSK
jgi:hypothetical protein